MSRLPASTRTKVSSACRTSAAVSFVPVKDRALSKRGSSMLIVDRIVRSPSHGHQSFHPRVQNVICSARVHTSCSAATQDGPRLARAHPEESTSAASNPSRAGSLHRWNWASTAASGRYPPEAGQVISGLKHWFEPSRAPIEDLRGRIGFLPRRSRHRRPWGGPRPCSECK